MGPTGQKRAATGRLQGQQVGFGPGGFCTLKQDFMYINTNECKCNPWAGRQEELSLPDEISA